MNIIPKKRFTWIVLLILAYGYYTSIQQDILKDKEIKAKSSAVALKSTEEKSSFFEAPLNYALNEIRKSSTGKAAVDAAITQSLKDKYGTKDISATTAQESGKVVTMDLLQGSGQSAQCGSTATINYDASVDGIIKFDSTTGKAPLTFKIGEGQVIKGLETGLLGMRKGGKRKIAIPSGLGFDDSNFKNDLVQKEKPVLYEVELLDVQNGSDTNDIVSIMDKSVGDNTSPEAFCGSKVNVTYKLMQNDIAVSAGELALTIGDGSVQLGLSNGIIGMKKGGVRNLNIPQSLLKTPENSIMPKDLQLPKEGTAIFDIILTDVK